MVKIANATIERRKYLASDSKKSTKKIGNCY